MQIIVYPEGSALGPEGLSRELFDRYWTDRWNYVVPGASSFAKHSPLPTDETYSLFQSSNIKCVHCRAGAVMRGEPLHRHYKN